MGGAVRRVGQRGQRTEVRRGTLFVEKRMEKVHTRSESHLAHNLSSGVDRRCRAPVEIEVLHQKAIGYERRIDESEVVAGAGERVPDDLAKSVDTPCGADVSAERAEIAHLAPVVDKGAVTLLSEKTTDHLPSRVDSTRDAGKAEWIARHQRVEINHRVGDGLVDQSVRDRRAATDFRPAANPLDQRDRLSRTDERHRSRAPEDSRQIRPEIARVQPRRDWFVVTGDQIDDHRAVPNPRSAHRKVEETVARYVSDLQHAGLDISFGRSSRRCRRWACEHQRDN